MITPNGNLFQKIADLLYLYGSEGKKIKKYKSNNSLIQQTVTAPYHIDRVKKRDLPSHYLKFQLFLVSMRFHIVK